MKSSILATILIVFIVSTSALAKTHQDAVKLDLNLENIECMVDGNLWSLDIPLAKGLSKEQLNAAGRIVCMSIKDASIPVQKLEHPDNMFYTSTGEKYGYVEHYISYGESIQDKLYKMMGGSEVISLKVNFYVLKKLIDEGFINPDVSVVDSPKISEILDIMTKHHDMWLIGDFYKPGTKTSENVNSYVCPDKNPACIKLNAFLPYTAVVPSGSKTFISQWFIDFCENNSESTLYNNDAGWSCDMTN